MKNIFLVLACTISMSLYCQTGQVTIPQTYAGVLSGASYSLDSMHFSSWSNARVGGVVLWQATKKCSVMSYAGLQVQKGDPVMIHVIKGIFQIDSNWRVEAGKMPSLTGLQRPHPISAGAQFEPSTLRRIPGGELGTHIKFIKDNFDFGLGAYTPDTSLELQARIHYGRVELSGFWQPGQDIYGSALSLDLGDVKSTFVYRSDVQDVFANLTTIDFMNEAFSFYNDMGYALTTLPESGDRLIREEAGVLRNFTNKKYAGTFGIGYVYETNCIVSYCFVHL